MNWSKKSGLFIIVLLAISLIDPRIPIAKANPDWLEGWDQRVKITIDQNDVDSALIDFPVLIYISSASGINGEDITFVFDELGANSLKIAVTESDGTTECFVEVEKWDFENEKAWLWAKIPSIASDVDTDIYLYYDNDHADNVNYVGAIESIPAENVWDSNFLAVYHLRDKTTSSISDSTSNDRDGAKASANNPIEANCIIDKGQDFSSDEIELTNMQNQNYGTIEAWVNPDATTSTQGIVLDEGAGYLVLGIFPLSYFGFTAFDTEADWIQSSAPFSIGTWYHIAGTYALGSKRLLYVQGSLDDTSVNNFGGLGSTANNLKMGRWAVDLNGQLDEVRISDVARTSEWIKATYETGRDDLLDFDTPAMGDSGSWEINTGTDDCIKRIKDGVPYFSTSKTTGYTGYAGATNYKMGGGFRFQSIGIPQGAIIDTAHVSFYAYESNDNVSINSRIKGEDTDDAITFSTIEDFDARTRTSEVVNWDNIGAWFVNNYYTSPDISTIIKEIVDREGWVSNNDIVIFWDDWDDRTDHVDFHTRRYDMYELGSGKYAILSISWHEPPIEAPSDPDLLFGAGFNASSPYVELHWNHSLVDVQFFEVQNSSDGESWTYLGQSTTDNYTDTQVVNGTERYYKVRACNQTGGAWYNSSFSDVNFETVHFIMVGANGVAPTVDDYSIIFLAIGLIVCLAIAFLYVKPK